MTLLEAPFRKKLLVRDMPGLPEEVRLVLVQLGLDRGETIEKIRLAPLGDPVSLQIGQQLFTLRKEICVQILVDVL
jgi:Fe2+ transport system protein FeoA